jgi:AraC family transcriptional regulator, ethanolamine operon transcriptional activator
MTLDTAASRDSLQHSYAVGDCFTLSETISTDADDHAASLQHWNQDYEQLSSGSFSGVMDEVWFGNVQIFRERTNQMVHETGRAWDGSTTFGIPNVADGNGLFCGAAFNVDSIIALGDGEEFDFRTPRSLDIVVMTVDANALGEFAESVYHIDGGLMVTKPGVLVRPAETAARLRELLSLLLLSIKSNPTMLNYPQIRKGMEQEMYNNIVLAVGDNGAEVAPALAPSRKAVVDKVREYILAYKEDPVTIADLCTALNVSRRTLQYSFQAVLNVNPVAYLRAVRLNATRRALRAQAGDPGATVADIAARWGFWHMSHFAADYKLMFGELPSQTLRNGHH